MSSITLPYGIERPPIVVTPRAAPLPPTVRPCVVSVPPTSPTVDAGEPAEQCDRPLPLRHVAAWCVAGSFGWAAIIGGGWMAVSVLRHVVF